MSSVLLNFPLDSKSCILTKFVANVHPVLIQTKRVTSLELYKLKLPDIVLSEENKIKFLKIIKF